MWISRKEYKFLKENAEKNIDAECEILRAKESQSKVIARAMEEYSTVLNERDELKLKVVELEHEIERLKQCGQRTKCNLIDDAVDSSLSEAIKLCVSEYDHDWECYGISTGGDEYRCRKCGAKKNISLAIFCIYNYIRLIKIKF